MNLERECHTVAEFAVETFFSRVHGGQFHRRGSSMQLPLEI